MLNAGIAAEHQRDIAPHTGDESLLLLVLPHGTLRRQRPLCPDPNDQFVEIVELEYGIDPVLLRSVTTDA